MPVYGRRQTCFDRRGGSAGAITRQQMIRICISS